MPELILMTERASRVHKKIVRMDVVLWVRFATATRYVRLMRVANDTARSKRLKSCRLGRLAVSVTRERYPGRGA
jgi:hypothetical protein